MSDPHPDPLDPIQNLEPAAQAGASSIGRSLDTVAAAAIISQAISLKRIADALEQQAYREMIAGIEGNTRDRRA